MHSWPTHGDRTDEINGSTSARSAAGLAHASPEQGIISGTCGTLELLLRLAMAHLIPLKFPVMGFLADVVGIESDISAPSSAHVVWAFGLSSSATPSRSALHTHTHRSRKKTAARTRQLPDNFFWGTLF